MIGINLRLYRRIKETYFTLFEVASDIFDISRYLIKISFEERLFLKSVSRSGNIPKETKRSIVSQIKLIGKQSVRSSKDHIANIGLLNGALLYTPGYREIIQDWLNSQFNSGPPSIYDKAADAVYNTTHVGGGQLHRLFDGGHSITGMWEAARKASPDDSFTEEVIGFAQAYFKDFITAVGMPIPGAPSTPSQYNEVIDQVNNFIPLYDVPRSWFGDIFQQSAAETVAPSIAAVILIFKFNEGEAEEFSKIAVHCLGFAAVQGSPIAIPIALIALARGFIKARQEKDYKGFLKGAAKAGAQQILIASAVALIGGPALTAIFVSILFLVILKKVYDREITKETISQITIRIDETLRTLIRNPLRTAQ